SHVKPVLRAHAGETLRPRLMRALEYDNSVFTALTDDEALRTLRLTQMDLIVKEATPPFKGLGRVISSVRHLCPNSVVLCVVPGAQSIEDESAIEAADFVLIQPFTTRQLQSLLRAAHDQLHLLE